MLTVSPIVGILVGIAICGIGYLIRFRKVIFLIPTYNRLLYYAREEFERQYDFDKFCRFSGNIFIYCGLIIVIISIADYFNSNFAIIGSIVFLLIFFYGCYVVNTKRGMNRFTKE